MQQHGDHAGNININVLEWITKPRTFSKGQNLPYHIKAVKRFLKNIKAPEEYHVAILVNSLDEECQLELFAHPEYQEDAVDSESLCALILKIFDVRKAGFSKLVRLLEIKQEAGETFCQFLTRLRVEGYKMFGDEEKEQSERFIISAFVNGLKNRSIAKAIETLEPDNSETALKLARKAEEQFRRETPVAPVDCYEMAIGKNKRFYGEKEDLEEMKKQIEFLTQQVMYLSNKLKFQNGFQNINGLNARRTRTYAGVVRNGPQYQGQQFRPATNFKSFRPQESRENNWNRNLTMTARCWNCDGAHLLRSCPKKLLCKACNRVGHVSRFCDSSNIRYIHEEPLEIVGAKEDLEETTLASWEMTDDHESVLDDSASPAIMTVQVGEDRIPRFGNVERQSKPRKVKSRRRRAEDVEIEGWIRYIEGETNQMPSRGDVNQCPEAIA